MKDYSETLNLPRTDFHEGQASSERTGYIGQVAEEQHLQEGP